MSAAQTNPTPTTGDVASNTRRAGTHYGYTVNGKTYELPGPEKPQLQGLTNDEKEGYLISKGYRVVGHMNRDPSKMKRADLSGMSEEGMRELERMRAAQRARDAALAREWTEEEKREFRAIVEAQRARSASATAPGME